MVLQMNNERASVLIVDDRPEKVLALEAVLEDLDVQIVRAYSGREALRFLLQQDFAVILLDVNMPAMDGFETASLIRQRKNSEHIPIIFITALGDDMHIARGYEIGAVDYIQSPVIPSVLRTKVAVFVELYVKTDQVRRQADSLRRRAQQLQKLTAAAVAINSALSIEKLLQVVSDTARDCLGTHQCITLFILNRASENRSARTMAVSSFSDKYEFWRRKSMKLDAIAGTIVAQSRTVTRMTERELQDHPDWEIVQNLKIPPVVGGMLAAPLTARSAGNVGIIYLTDRVEGAFNADDEAVLMQLAQMASIAIENSLYAEERETNRIKDEFLSTLSHELRTPLNAIMGWTHILRLENPNLDADHGLEIIERNVRAQTKLIEDLLDVSRITTGKLRLNPRGMRLGAVVSAAIDAIKPIADAKHISIKVHSEGDDQISGDPDRLQQVVWNLLTNAVKFTPEGGSVEVISVREKSKIQLEVRDNGIGLSPGFLPFVFDRFRQADSTSTRSHGGLGIGLTIVRHIIDLHGGTVVCESAGEGQGTKFRVTLPVIAATPDPAINGKSQPKHPVAAPPAKLQGTRILVVDDEPDAREVVAEVFRRAGAIVSSAASAAAGMTLLAEKEFDLLVSDVAMPGMDGLQFIQQIRQTENGKNAAIPAMALTAYARDEDRRKAVAAGFQMHLAKPVEPTDLIASAGELLAGVRAPVMEVSA